MQRTKIEWTDWTVNPIRARSRIDGRPGHFCVKKSPGCDNCYASAFQLRFGTHLEYTRENRNNVESYLDEGALDEMVRRPKAGQRVFVCDMTDLFLSRHHDAWIKAVLDRIESRPDVVYQILTKRPVRAGSILRDRYGRKGQAPLNLWMGVSVENQEQTWRIESARRWPVSLIFISFEPLLGMIRPWPCHACGAHVSLGTAGRCQCADKNPITWAIAGGESGRKPRPLHPDWVRSLRDDCQSGGVPFFFKGWGEWRPLERNDPSSDRVTDTAPDRTPVCLVKPDGRTVRPYSLLDAPGAEMVRVGKKAAGRMLDGREWSEMPEMREIAN